MTDKTVDDARDMTSGQDIEDRLRGAARLVIAGIVESVKNGKMARRGSGHS